jgi:hypothetical protein
LLINFIDIRAPDHALTHAFPLFELPAQTKTIQGLIRNLSAMNLASQAVREATNEASLNMAKALLRFVDSDDLLAKRSKIDGCIDLELSVTALGRTIDTLGRCRCCASICLLLLSPLAWSAYNYTCYEYYRF